jgi:sortase A
VAEESRVIRRLGTLVIVAGVGLLVWTATVYFWKDPFTTAYTAFEQRRLESSLEETFDRWQPVAAPPTRPAQPAAEPKPVDVRREAKAYLAAVESGDAVARLEVPRLDLDVIVVNGTDTGSLRRGPGRHLDSAMPGGGQLVYIAGHRTTYGAPFSDIDRLERGDRILVEVPYATFEYRVTGKRIVDAGELSVLKSRGREELVLQACHPRFFASERYLVYARPFQVVEKQA